MLLDIWLASPWLRGAIGFARVTSSALSAGPNRQGSLSWPEDKTVKCVGNEGNAEGA